MEEQKPKVMNIQEVSTFWSQFSDEYSKIDSFTNTFYYTLAHMLELHKSNHILEIACGTCRLIPLAATLKQKQTTYLATDLTQSMVDIGRKRIQEYIGKIGVEGSVENWMLKHNITLKAANGEEPIQSPYKFDRIIANLVLMLTEDPYKMMRNLHSMAAEGCLMGVTIWGDKSKSNFFPLFREAVVAAEGEAPAQRAPFHLYGKLDQLAKETGWEVVVSWQQNAPLPHLQIDQELLNHVKLQTKGKQVYMDYVLKKTKKIFQEKKVLNFPCQLAILKRK